MAKIAPEACPKCGGEMWDNRGEKKNPKQPDFKCKDKDGCGEGVWLDRRKGKTPGGAQAAAAAPATPPEPMSKEERGRRLHLLLTLSTAIVKHVAKEHTSIMSAEGCEVGDSPEAFSSRVNTQLCRACDMGLHR